MSQTSTDVIEQQIEVEAPLERVWRALTDHQAFGQWFGVALESPFEEGKPTKGNLTHPGVEHLVMEVKVDRIEPMRRFSFFWHPYAVDPKKDYSGEPPTLVTFTLLEHEGRTKVTLTESGFDALPPERRDEAFRMNAGGWAQQVKNLAGHVRA
jgi:uncharacterized protein YndB with AHSA1/START domain